MDIPKRAGEFFRDFDGRLIVGIDAQEDIEIAVMDCRQIVAYHVADHVCFLPARNKDGNLPFFARRFVRRYGAYRAGAKKAMPKANQNGN